MNHLSGEIPQVLTSLTFLSWLNLSYNNLTGRIPEGNQFFSFPYSSFEGNAGLCGSQVPKQCAKSDRPSRIQKFVAGQTWRHPFVHICWLGVWSGFRIGNLVQNLSPRRRMDLQAFLYPYVCVIALWNICLVLFLKKDNGGDLYLCCTMVR